MANKRQSREHQKAIAKRKRDQKASRKARKAQFQPNPVKPKPDAANDMDVEEGEEELAEGNAIATRDAEVVSQPKGRNTSKATIQRLKGLIVARDKKRLKAEEMSKKMQNRFQEGRLRLAVNPSTNRLESEHSEGGVQQQQQQNPPATATTTTSSEPLHFQVPCLPSLKPLEVSAIPLVECASPLDLNSIENDCDELSGNTTTTTQSSIENDCYELSGNTTTTTQSSVESDCYELSGNTTTTTQSSKAVPRLSVSKRPQFYKIRSNTRNAVNKRLRRCRQYCHPRLQEFASIIPHAQKQAPAQEPTLDLPDSLRMSVSVTSRKYRELATLKVVVPERVKNDARKAMFDNSGYEPIDDPDGQGFGWIRSIQRTLVELFLLADLETLIQPIRVVVAIDGGGQGTKVDSTKIILHLADGAKPSSPLSCGVVAVVLGAETYENLEHVFRLIDAEIDYIQKNGMTYLERVYDNLSFLVGDCKLCCTALGLQGGKAMFPCHLCWIRSGPTMQSYDPNEPAQARTQDNLEEMMHRFFGQMATRQSEAAMARLHQECMSFKQPPLITSIPVDNFCPPVLHLCMGVINATFASLKDKDPTRAEALLKAAGVTVQYGRKADFTGNSGEKLVDHVLSLKPAEIAADGYLSAFAAARPLLSLAKLDADYTKAREVVSELMLKLRAIRHITTKLHMVEAHICEFMDRHSAWGRMTEQDKVEGCHKYANKVVVSMPGHKPIKRIKKYLLDQLIRNMP